MPGLRVMLLATAVAAAMLVSGRAMGQQGQPDTSQPPPQAQPEVPEHLRSPRRTIETFLEAFSAGRNEDAFQCLDVPEVLKGKAEEQAAFELFHVLDWARWQSWRIPSAVELTESGRTTYTLFPQSGNLRHASLQDRFRTRDTIVVEKQDDGRWLFSAETMAAIGDLFDELEVAGTLDASELRGALWIEENWVPDVLKHHKVLGLKYWQWIGLFLLALVGIILDFSVRGVLTIIAVRLIRRRGGEASRETLRLTVRPFGLIVAAIFWLYAIDLLRLPTPALRFLLPTVKFFAMIAGVWAAYRLTDLLSEVAASKAEATETKIDDLLIPLVRKAVKIFIAAIGLIYIADNLDIEILPLLTGLGIGGIAVAFAAKDTIENFFGSIAVIVDNPFEVGDWVVLDGDVEGTVEELGFRSTRIRTFYNSLVTVPNATLVRAKVDNYGRRKYRRWKTHLNLVYGTPPEKIESFCEGIRELIRIHPYTRKDYYQVWMHQFGAHSLDILVYVFHEAPDWQTELRERQRLMLDIIRLADKLGVEFAFPTQTLHLFQEERSESDVEPSAPSTGDPTGKSLRDGRFAARRITEHAVWKREKPGPHRIADSPASADDDDETQVESKTAGDA